MYTTMEYYSNIFPYIYTNMIKVGELSGSLTNSLKQAVEYLDDTEALNKKIRSMFGCVPTRKQEENEIAKALRIQ